MPFAKTAVTQQIGFKVTLLAILVLSQIIWIPKIVQATNQETIDKTRKIVMMLNIAAKEFEEGVVDGKIVVPPEYQESKVFLEQAIERFERISDKVTDKEKKKSIKSQLTSMMTMVNDKVDSQKIWKKVNSINSELLATFNIRIYKTPITPVSLANGKMLYERNCYVCHGMKGDGDGPLAIHFDPSPAVLSNPK